jgi:MATE family multidrug resistance protein
MDLAQPNSGCRTTWWTRPNGGREVLRVAAPLIVSSLSWTMLTFIDRMMLNHVSGAAMAAAFSSSVAWFAVAALPLGVCAYANTFVAQYDGARQPRRIGRVIWQAICWIFGHLGFPAWGVAGAASATVLCLWLKALVYLVLFLQPKHRERFGTTAGLCFDGELLQRMLKYGGPSGFQMLLDVTGYTVFILLVGRLGGIAAEATSMTFSISTLAFMPIYGLHIATSVLVGERLGENRDDMAASVTMTSLQISLGYMLFISLLYFFTPSIFLTGFFSHESASSADQEAVREAAALLLKFVAAYNLLDATQLILVGALKGAGDTRFLLFVSLLLASLLAGFSYLSVEVWRLSVYGCWVLVVFWCTLSALIYVLRFRQGKWRSMRVIEMGSQAAAIAQ